MASLLQLVNIDRRYLDSDRPLVILDKANFSLEQGQTVALVAPSGAGKSTLLHIAGLLERPNGGDVVLRGHSCSNLSDNDRTRYVATISVLFISSITCCRNLRLWKM